MNQDMFAVRIANVAPSLKISIQKVPALLDGMRVTGNSVATAEKGYREPELREASVDLQDNSPRTSRTCRIRLQLGM